MPTGRLGLSSLPTARAQRCIAFIERYCRTPKASPGAPARSRIKLRPWQREFIEGIFAENPPRQALLSVARKNGKTLLAACIAVYALIADGVDSAEVLVVSSDEKTAMVCWNLARRIIELEPRLANHVQLFKDKIYVPSTDSVLTVLAGDPDRAQGRNPSLAICDEVHVMRAEMWQAMTLGQGTRENPLCLGISTECAPSDEGNLMAQLVDVGRRGDDPNFYFMEFTTAPDCDIHDEVNWRAANPQLGDTISVEHFAAMVKTTPEPLLRRFYLNSRVAVGGSWLPVGAWDACKVPGGIADGSRVVLACDGSYSLDTCALVAVSVGVTPHVDVAGFWAPSLTNPVDVLNVEQAIRDACARWDVVEVVFDPYRFARSMSVLESEGFPVASFPQSAQRMAPATVALYEAIINKQVTQSGNKDMAAHFSHAVVRDDAIRGYRITKPSKSSPQKIDLAVSVIMAHARAQWHASQKPKRNRVVLYA